MLGTSQVSGDIRHLCAIGTAARVMAGTAIPSNRPVVDSSFDVGLVFTFRNEADLHNYLVHARHQQLLLNTIKPYVAHYIVYDITEND